MLLLWQSILEFTDGRGSPSSVLGMMESTGKELRNVIIAVFLFATVFILLNLMNIFIIFTVA